MVAAGLLTLVSVPVVARPLKSIVSARWPEPIGRGDA